MRSVQLSILAKMKEQLVAYEGPQCVVFLIGHPGAGKTTLSNAIPSIENLVVFHADHFIDWDEVTTRIMSQKKASERDIMPAAHKEAFELMLDMFPDQKVIIWDGGGVLTDLIPIAQSFDKSLQLACLLIDADPQIISDRLSLRGDGMTRNPLSISEYHENLEALATIPSATVYSDRESPEQQFSSLFSLISKLLSSID